MTKTPNDGPRPQDGPENPDDPESRSLEALTSGISPTLKLSAAEIVITLALVGQNRALASLIGPGGFGVFGLLQSLFRFLSSFSSSWLAVPLTKWVAESEANERKGSLNLLYSLGLTTALAILVPVGIIFAVFHRPIIDTFLGGEIQAHHYFIFIAIAAFTAIRTVQSAVLQGLLMIGRITLIRTVSAGIQVALVLVLVSQFGITGLFYGLAISLFFATAMAFAVMHKSAGIAIVRPSLRSDEARKLAQFGGANLALLVVGLSTEYIQRLIVLNGLGIEAVGLMVAALQIVVYMDVFNRSAVFYWFAKMSKSSNARDLMDDYSGFSRLMLLVGIPIVLGGILFGQSAVEVLLGPRFSTLTSSLYLFMIWQFFNLIHNAPAMAIMALAKIRVHAIATFCSSITVPLVIYFGIEFWGWGFNAIGIALVTGGIVAYLPRVAYMGFAQGIWGTRQTWVLTGVGIALIAMGIFMRDWSFLVKVGAWTVMTSTLVVLTPRTERSAILASVLSPVRNLTTRLRRH